MLQYNVTSRIERKITGEAVIDLFVARKIDFERILVSKKIDVIYIDAGAGFTSSLTPISPWKDHASCMLGRGDLKFHIGY